MAEQGADGDNIFQFPTHRGGGTGGPDNPMLDQRVAKLEEDMKEVKASLKSIELAVSEIKHLPKMSDYAALKADLAEVKGKLSNMPNTFTILGIVFTTWALGSGLLIFALTRLIKP